MFMLLVQAKYWYSKDHISENTVNLPNAFIKQKILQWIDFLVLWSWLAHVGVWYKMARHPMLGMRSPNAGVPMTSSSQTPTISC